MTTDFEVIWKKVLLKQQRQKTRIILGCVHTGVVKLN
jgi:hypothetical protein